MEPFIKQAWTVSGVLLNMFGIGMAFSYPSSLMPALIAKDAEIQADLNTASWIASSVGIGAMPGFFLSSYCMDRFGRRIAHGLVIIPGSVGCDTTRLLMGRFLCGITVGATFGLGAVVIGEFTSPKHRGMFLMLKTAANCVGGMLVHIIGNFCSWRTVALISIVPNIAAFLITMTWPESPAWLAENGEFEKSEKAFFWLRGKDENSENEIKEMIHVQMKRLKNLQVKSFGQKIEDFLNKFTKKDFLKPVFIIFLGTCLLEVTGRHIFPAYALDIIGEITGSREKSFYYTLWLDLTITASVTLSSVLVNLMKRRFLLFSTGFASIVFLAIACTYLFLVSRDVISKDYPWIPMGLFIAFFILANIGCTPLPLAFLGELLPLAHRGAGSAVGGLLMSLWLSFTLKVTPYLLAHCKVYGTFAILGAIMTVLLIILYFILPETKDRTLQEIEDFFNGRLSKHENVKNTMVDAKNGDVKVKMVCESEVKLLSVSAPD